MCTEGWVGRRAVQQLTNWSECTEVARQRETKAHVMYCRKRMADMDKGWGRIGRQKQAPPRFTQRAGNVGTAGDAVDTTPTQPMGAPT